MLNGFTAAAQFSTQGRELLNASHIEIDTHNYYPIGLFFEFCLCALSVNRCHPNQYELSGIWKYNIGLNILFQRPVFCVLILPMCTYFFLWRGRLEWPHKTAVQQSAAHTEQKMTNSYFFYPRSSSPSGRFLSSSNNHMSVTSHLHAGFPLAPLPAASLAADCIVFCFWVLQPV